MPFGACLREKVFAPNRAFCPPQAGKTHSGPTSTVGSAEASSFGPRPAPHKVFFAMYTPPQKTDYTLFAALRRRELCETSIIKKGAKSVIEVTPQS